ncbi:ROK family protein [Kineococcus gypseus]|uniref:ROK family protein n=1 Tax=Kineococcus gypseus TaxID=1637102 RepID=UPI003D7E9431
MPVQAPIDGLSATLQVLRDGQPRTRAELSLLTGQARSTIAERVDRLLAAKLIAPSGKAMSTGGRPSTTFAFNPTARVVLAINLDERHAHVAVTDLSAKILVEDRVSVILGDGPQVVLPLVATTCRRIIGAAGCSLDDVIGVGLGLPGPVDHATGQPINTSTMSGWQDTDVQRQLQSQLTSVPVLVDNDANIMALGERAVEYPATNHLLFLKVGTQIDAGIISDGSIMRGAQGIAGSIGHVIVPGRDNIPCRCGNTGCLDAVASGMAIAAILADADVHATQGFDVAAQVRAGDEQAIAAVRDAGRALGIVLSTCVSLLNPAVIVIGGDLAVAGEHLLAGIRETVYRRSLPLTTQHLHIAISRTGNRAAIYGASTSVIEYVFSGDFLETIV